MAEEIVALFGDVPHGVVVDATLGGAGHTMRLLEAYPMMSVLGIDQDEMAIEHASALRANSPDIARRLDVQRGRFDSIDSFLAQRNIDSISGALFDLGVSSPQLDKADRGFSYRHDGPLDMRMDKSAQLSAADVVNGYEVQQLTDVLRNNADERFAFRIAKAIVAARPIANTTQLAEIVANAIPAPARRTGGHPAKRTFQALRIEANDELGAVTRALPVSLDLLMVGGRVVVLSFQSLEDRIVKEIFVERSTSKTPRDLPVDLPEFAAKFALVSKSGETPSDQELANNPRSASVRLRAIERLAA
jgi:16S rRNA (cytosine1402-N4)-methyltransferase